MYMATATHAQFEAKWTQLGTLTGQLERSAQIPLPTLIAIGHEVQTTLDQCERLASKSSQLEGEHEVVADLVIGYDLAMAQKQPKLTADWFTHRMSAMHTPVAAASKKRPCRNSRTSVLWAGRMYTNQLPHGNRPPPHLRGTAPLTNPAGAAGRLADPLRTQAGAGERTSPLLLPPASNPGTTHHPLEAAELAGAEPGEGGGGAGKGGSGGGGGGGGGPMCSLCTNAGKPVNHSFTACPLTTCHKCGQLGHVQRHCPN